MALNTENSSSVAASTTKVLEVSELRERILLTLPVQDLFVLQRVCKNWQATMKTSITISQKMFLQPMGPTLQSSSDGVFESHRITMNPVSKVYQYERKVLAKNDDASRFHKISIGLRLPVGHGRRRYAWPGLPSGSSVEHSWRNMLLTQPPIFKVSIQYQDWREGGTDDSSLRCPTGVTIGALSDHCTDLVSRYCLEPGTQGTGLSSYMGITVLVMDPELGGSV
ncbi:hypothetical protein CLAFUW4_09145 [Fulvia fulva]|uniref:F-box domain-containing protein n=1 Tax=Passalora fulva TaxID=5499 RepID=A0A9Q8PG40_PASFU|nr:uncharacterized protein CLAFUR5_09256 [Fulvia fulva]KAK4613317.1 hypothetical protein CLAFUR4_09151 [Fulvia fulva]KAK4614657.1 hypothetical protein CLAFUR0_09143 [Fulvia fulva]UJO21858.1 hypothetical protein CLAFUR5_09256 [Fulvia fulva]WPV20434.1 hypothetical protein CLAFUW4_09145 [Fulvia fulva]WPV34743.1 hypothetical protein CLAFUW7_09146 [Fulvia fulva]